MFFCESGVACFVRHSTHFLQKNSLTGIILKNKSSRFFPHASLPIILLLLALLFFPDCKIWHGRNSYKKIRHVSFALPWRRISIPRRILKFLFFTFLCQRDTKDSKLERFSTSFFLSRTYIFLAILYDDLRSFNERHDVCHSFSFIS